MEEPMNDFSSTQKKISTGFYILLVVAWLITIAGSIWTVADILSPTGKLGIFLGFNLGYQIAIVAGFLAGLFFLLVFFIGFYKRGTKSLLRILFKKRELEEKYKNKLAIKLAAAGLLGSLIAILVGLSIAIITDFIVGPDTSSSFSLTALLQTFTIGTLVLISGISLFGVIGIAIFIIYFWRNGYYLILRIFGGLDKS